MRSPRATTFSIACSAPESTGAGARRAIRSLRLTGRERLLDVCTGTADVALQARGRAQHVLGVDFAGAMLAVGATRSRAAGAARTDRARARRCDPASRARSAVDAATVAFGIRNVERPELACAEMARAMRPGGRLAILEFGVPRLPGSARSISGTSSTCCQRSGESVSGDRVAYSYLPASVGSFPPPAQFVAMLERAGFADVRAVPLTFGIVYLYTGTRAR